MNANKKLSLISVVFFLSGCSALIFETVWFRVTSTVLGSSVWSAAAVLMAFMGGLAIGNGLMAVLGHRVVKPAKFYILIEAFIGIAGFSVVLLLPKLSPFINDLLFNISSSNGMLSVSRFAIACIFLLLPAVVMGATLPVMQKLVHQYDNSFVNSIARLYGWNTIGAVAGVLLAEFYLVKYFGLLGTAALACALNFLVVYIMLKVFGVDAGVIVKQEKSKFQLNISRYMVVAFFSGMLLLALEIIWFRYLLVTRDGDSINFAIMLATVLVGIGLGGLVVSRIKVQEKHVLNVAFYMLITASIVTFVGYYCFQWYFDLYMEEITRSSIHYILGAAILILPTSFISGMIFPLLGDCIYRKNKVVAASSGYLTLANTIGAVIGSAVATFYLLPEVGIENSIFIVVLTYLLVSFLLIEKNKLRVIVVLSLIILIGLVFPKGMVTKSYEKVYGSKYSDRDLVVFHEGLNQTIAYLEKNILGQRTNVRLVTNSHSMSSTEMLAQRYMRLYSYFPYLFQNKIEDVLQISYGVGNTAESVVHLPDLKSFNVVDMSPDIFELSVIAHDISGVYPLNDKRTTSHVEDGRFFLQTTHDQYDLITAEPPPPKNAGVVNLYTQEYFKLIYNALKPMGITTYWLPLHSLNEMDALAIIKAFCNVFDDCSLWNGAQLDFMLVGSKSGLGKVTVSSLAKKWSPDMKLEFSKIGFDSPAQVFATYIGDHEYLKGITELVKPVTDNYPQRITPYHEYSMRKSVLYGHFLNVTRRKNNFSNSLYVKNILSKEVIFSTESQFSREAVISSVYLNSTYDKELLKKDFSLWDETVNAMSKNKRDYLLLVLFGKSHRDMSIMEVEFESVTTRELEPYEYVMYLFLDKQYGLLELEVKDLIVDENVSLLEKYRAYRLYLLTKIYNSTAQTNDIDKLISFKNDLKSNQFIDWFKDKVK